MGEDWEDLDLPPESNSSSEGNRSAMIAYYGVVG